MDAIRLAQLAVDAQMVDFHLRQLQQLAKPFPGPGRQAQELALPVELRVKFEDTALPAWEISTIGAVRRAAHAANAFLDELDWIDEDVA